MGPPVIGRHTLRLDAPGGTVLKPAPRRRRAEPPDELRRALASAAPVEDPREATVELARVDRMDRAEKKTDQLAPVIEVLGALAEGHAPGLEAAARVADAGFAGLERLARRGEWTEVIRVGRQLARLLALTARWAALVQTLRTALGAAMATDDARTKAWALHELGTLHRCVGDRSGARALLKRSSEIRKAIGDKPGLAASRHNARLSGRHALAAARPGVTSALFAGASVALVGTALVLRASGADTRPPTPPTTASSAHTGSGPAKPPAHPGASAPMVTTPAQTSPAQTSQPQSTPPQPTHSSSPPSTPTAPEAIFGPNQLDFPARRPVRRVLPSRSRSRTPAAGCCRSARSSSQAAVPGRSRRPATATTRCCSPVLPAPSA